MGLSLADKQRLALDPTGANKNKSLGDLLYENGGLAGGSSPTIETLPDFELVLNSTRFFLPPEVHVNPSIASESMTATTHRFAWIFQAPKSGPLSKIKVRLGTVTTAQPIRVRVETVSVGLPTGTLVAAGAEGTIPIGSVVTSTSPEVTLTTPVTVTKGQLLAIVFDCPSAVPNLNFAKIQPGSNAPLTAKFTTAWSKDITYGPQGAIMIDGAWTTTFGIQPIFGGASATVNSTTTPDEVGNKIQVPFRCKVTGIWVQLQGTGALNLKLYDSLNNVLGTIPVEANAFVASTSIPAYLFFTSEIEVARDSIVRVTREPTTATSLTCRYSNIIPGAEAAMSYGGRIHRTVRTDAGAWTDEPSNRDHIGLIVSQIYG